MRHLVILLTLRFTSFSMRSSQCGSPSLKSRPGSSTRFLASPLLRRFLSFLLKRAVRSSLSPEPFYSLVFSPPFLQEGSSVPGRLAPQPLLCSLRGRSSLAATPQSSCTLQFWRASPLFQTTLPRGSVFGISPGKGLLNVRLPDGVRRVLITSLINT